MAQTNIILPKIANSLYVGRDVPDIIEHFKAEIDQLSGDWLYADQISLKLQEALVLIKSIDNDQPFVKKMREKWSKDLRKIFINLPTPIEFDMRLRRKSLFATLQKINRIIASGKSIDSLRDLMGVEIIIYTKGPVDTAESISQCYIAANETLKYFSSSKFHGGSEKFLLCDAAELKDACNEGNSRKEKMELLSKVNPDIYIPEKTELKPELCGFVKDYIIRPKTKTAYQGLQFVIAAAGYHFEVQIKSQVMRDYLDDSKSPGNHNIFRMDQTEATKNRLKNDPSITQLDLSFDPKKVYHVSGFRPQYDRDLSGIIAPVVSSLSQSTHQ